MYLQHRLNVLKSVFWIEILNQKIHTMKIKLFLIVSVLCLNLSHVCATIYHSNDDKSQEQAIGYSKTTQSACRYLAYRDMPGFFAKYVSGNKVLDYGAGVGISTEFLLTQNFDVTGVDISKEMLTQAKAQYPNATFDLIENGQIGSPHNSYDLVFSSFVLFELGSEEQMIAYLNEAKRVLKDDGVLIALTGSQDMYSKDWFLFKTNYPENNHLTSGALAKVYLCDADIEFTDFYWTEADYRNFFSKAGFELAEVHYPLGNEKEQFPWKDEKTHSPYVIFVAKKSGMPY